MTSEASKLANPWLPLEFASGVTIHVRAPGQAETAAMDEMLKQAHVEEGYARAEKFTNEVAAQRVLDSFVRTSLRISFFTADGAKLLATPKGFSLFLYACSDKKVSAAEIEKQLGDPENAVENLQAANKMTKHLRDVQIAGMGGSESKEGESDGADTKTSEDSGNNP